MIRFCFFWAALALGLSLPAAGPAFALQADNPVAAVPQSIVAVLPVWPKRPAGLDEPEGSGVVVGDGTIVLTADHILGAAVRVRIRNLDGVIAEASIIGRDSETDLALIRIPMTLPALQLSGYPSIGGKACAVGNAFGLGISLTCGTVSAVRRSGVGFNPIEDFVQTDAAVNPGMSGGALVDEDGALIGILSAIFTKQSDANIGVNFAVSGPLARVALERLRAEHAKPWPRAGLQLRPFPPPGGEGRSGAAVVDIIPGSAASASGLMVGDVIMAAGARRVFGPADMRVAVAIHPAGAPLVIDAIRDGAMHKLEIIIAE